MKTWLHTPYFLIATGLMAIVQVDKFLDGKTPLVGAIFTSVIGGIFWGAIATYISKKLGKIK